MCRFNDVEIGDLQPDGPLSCQMIIGLTLFYLSLCRFVHPFVSRCASRSLYVRVVVAAIVSEVS